MKKNEKIFLILALTLAVLLSACGKAKANQGFYIINLYGYECITNDVALWCSNE